MRLKNALVSALIALFPAACSDSPTQPATLVTAETRAAIRVASVLPTLSTLIAGVDPQARDEGAGARLAYARNLWELADVLGDEGEARRLREEAYAEAIPVLARTLTDADLAAATTRLQQWTTLAGSVVRPGAIAGFTKALEDGRRHLQRAREAQLEGRRADALHAVLRAAERLDTTTPRAVGTQLTRAAEKDLARSRPEDGAERYARAERLLRGARESLNAGDYELAIRRAYYAGRLLRNGGDTTERTPRP
jgi:hypothetical protein